MEVSIWLKIDQRSYTHKHKSGETVSLSSSYRLISFQDVLHVIESQATGWWIVWWEVESVDHLAVCMWWREY